MPEPTPPDPHAPKPLWEKALIVLPLIAANTAAYLILNAFPPHPPDALPFTPIDHAAPFWLWTLWPYALLLLSDAILPFLVRSRRRFTDMLGAYGVAICTNAFIWSRWPTVYPRPWPPEGDSLTHDLYHLLVAVDAPTSCFPSGHITVPAVMLYALSTEHPRLAFLVPAWLAFLLLALTILTTRQHYALDLLGGLATAALGVLTVAAARRLLPARSLVN